jgi:VanZ family protein
MDAIWIVMIAVVATFLSVLVGMRAQTTPGRRPSLVALAVLGLGALAADAVLAALG